MSLGGDHLVSLGGDHLVTLGGDNLVSLGGDHLVTLGGDHLVTLGGDHLVTLGGDDNYKRYKVGVDGPYEFGYVELFLLEALRGGTKFQMLSCSY